MSADSSVEVDGKSDMAVACSLLWVEVTSGGSSVAILVQRTEGQLLEI